MTYEATIRIRLWFSGTGGTMIYHLCIINLFLIFTRQKGQFLILFAHILHMPKCPQGINAIVAAFS